MKILYLIISFFLLSFSTIAKNNETLTIYTYDSFVSEWGPGPIIKEIFEKKFDKHLKFIAVDSAATLLTRVILEGSSTKADIVLGLDMNLIDEAEKLNLFQKHSLEKVKDRITLPIQWESNGLWLYIAGIATTTTIGLVDRGG